MFIAYLPLLILYNLLQIYYNENFTCSGLEKVRTWFEPELD